MSTGSTRAAIIGGGIAGPVTALALHRIGVQPTVYEAYEHGAEQAGAFLMAAPNGLAALQLLGAHTSVLAAGFPTPRFAVSTGKGRVLGETVSTTTVPGRPEPVTIRRSDLYRAITAEVRRAGIPIEYGKRLAGVDESDDGLRTRFTDGSSVTAELLVGADGLRSRTRTLVDPAAPAPRYLGLVGCGGYARTALLDSSPGVFHFVFGKRAFFGYTVPRPGEVWWFANLPRRPEPTRPELDELRGETLRQVLIEAFAEDRVPAAAVIRETEHLIDALPMHDLAPLPTWHRGRMVLTGDAAHITSPSSGQGASLAIEDAVVLAQCLRDLPDQQQAFQRYQELRRPRVKKIFDAAVRTNSTKAAGPVARRLRAAIMRVVFALADPGKAQAEVHDFTIDWDQPVRPAAQVPAGVTAQRRG
ncbi:MAG TPA: FAD-dependent monooxygenase [Pseudonocardiaceae bacterium]|nr:FAD-dependent monooxygenase [Pseudonocardiaceae bacterium]